LRKKGQKKSANGAGTDYTRPWGAEAAKLKNKKENERIRLLSLRGEGENGEASRSVLEPIRTWQGKRRKKVLEGLRGETAKSGSEEERWTLKKISLSGGGSRRERTVEKVVTFQHTERLQLAQTILSGE